MNRLKIYFRLLRVNNYVKNLFVFAPLFFDFQFNYNLIFNAVITFIAFCLLASGVYIFNDVFDLETDRVHPIKRKRPLASGVVSIKEGISIAILLITFSLLTVSFVKVSICVVFICYLIVNVLYNLFLKKIPVVDVLVISCCFIIRIFAGSYATNIPASYWIIIMTFLLSMFLGFSKRRADVILAKTNGTSHSNIKIYSTRTINGILYLFAALISTVYFGYTISQEVVFRMESSYVFLTTFFVIMGVFRYIQLIKSSKVYKDPTATVIDDWKLQGIIFIWILSFIIIKYI